MLLLNSLWVFAIVQAQPAVNAFYYASEIVIDSKGNLFVSGKNNKIIKITPDGHAYHFAGHPKGYTQCKDGKGAEAMFLGVEGLAIDLYDNIYVADYVAIRKVTPEGVVTTVSGNPNAGVMKDGGRSTATFHRLGAIAVDKTGTLYVVDEIFDSLQNRTRNIIRKISPSGNVQTIKNEDGTVYTSHFIEGLACDRNGNLFVAKVAWSTCIDKITPDGVITTVAGVYDENVKKRSYFKEGDIKTARIIKPRGLAFNQSGELIFSDSWIDRILKIADNKVTIIAGGGGKSAEGANFMSGGYSAGSADGKGKQAGFASPNGIAFDKNGNLFIVDASSNSCIRKLSPDGTVTTFCKQYFNAKTKQYEETPTQGEEVVKAVHTDNKNVPSKTDSMLQSLQKQIDVAMNDPQIRKYIKDAQAVDVDSINKAVRDAVRNSGQNRRSYDSSSFALPRRNSKLLASLPQKAMTPVELESYLENIDKKYTSILVAQGTKLPDVSSLSGTDIGYASTLYLLDGSGYQAAWCAIKAVEKAPDDIVVLNNAGGILNACGFQPVAIPVLQTALDKSPGNSTIENNIGQSYMGLGDVSKAAGYLQQALSSSPYHPHANFSMACIEYSKGNKSGALNYVQKSLRGSFTDPAMHLLFKLKPDARLLNILKGHYKPTDYFNEDKYHLLPQCENVNDVVRMKAEYKGYREMLERVKNQFEDIENSENELGMKSMMEKTKNYKNSGVRTAPFSELGAMMVLEINLRLGDEREKLYRAQTNYNEKIKELGKEYHDGISHARSCGEQLSLGNKYMEAAAVATREYQKIWLPVFKEYFTDFAYWGRVQSADKHLQRAAYAGAVRGYLGELLRLAETHFAELCDPETDLKKEQQDYVFKEPDCGIDIGMNLGIGSFRIDCEKMEYHFGGLLVADVVHTYKAHSTTIAIGAGLDLKFGGEKLKAGPIQGGFGATGKMQYFLTFDGTRPSDQGFIWEGAIEYEQNFNTELGTRIKKIDEVKTNSLDLSAKTVLSIQNGFNSSGSLYEQLDKILEVKPDKQINKNVKIFNSQK